MTPYNIVTERRDLLDKLHEIQLKGFPDIEETPTSRTASLPTPQGGAVVLDADVEVPSEYVPPGDLLSLYPYHMCSTVIGAWLNPSATEYPAQPPGAPRMKDYDSFTDGTGHGSFESLPAGDTNEHGEPVYRINSLSLELLPQPDMSLASSIETWRNHVSINTSPMILPPPAPTSPVICSSSPTKRSRSTTSVEGRRTRARAQSLSSASSVLNSFEWILPPTSRTLERRPPSRATSAPD